MNETTVPLTKVPSAFYVSLIWISLPLAVSTQGWLRLSVKSARGRLFRRRGSMLVARFVFAPDG